MIWNSFSFFLTNTESESEAFLRFNSNILETNLVNILILLGLLIYGYKTIVTVSLDNRQKEIIQTIENAQKDVVNASNYYYLAEKGFTQSFFWLQCWKAFYQKDKIDLVTTNYTLVKTGITEAFFTTESLIDNFEKKAFITLQQYVIFVTASKILRKFLALSEAEKSKVIEVTIFKLGGTKK